jgi:pilus assembly protein Flp/PilA
MRKMIGFLKNESGATAIEYGLLASLIAVVIVAALQLLGPQLATTFNNVSAAL